MKINEVEKKLGITRDALRYYEKEKLIVPLRDNNGYRSYCQDDLRVIKNIMMLRSLDISIDEIKAIFNNELLISECLENKEQELINEINRKRNIINQIKMNLVRRKAYYAYLKVPEYLKDECYVLFGTNQLILKMPYINEEESYRYEDIQKITFSLCSRTYKPELDDNEGYIGFHIGYPHFGLISQYYIDLDVYLLNGKYEFESISLDNISSIFTVLEEKNVVVEDVIGLKEIFKKHSDYSRLTKYIDNNIRKWQRKYNLDNPRGTEILDQSQKFQNYIVTNVKSGKIGQLFLLKQLFKPYSLLIKYILLVLSGILLFIYIISLVK